MRIDLEIDLQDLPDALAKDGLIAIKLPRDQQLRFKTLNDRHEKKLSEYMRKFAIQLMDAIESRKAG